MGSWGRSAGAPGDARRRRRRAIHPLAVLAALAAAALAIPSAAAAAVIYPPNATSAVKTASGEELRGMVWYASAPTAYRFEYGTTTAYGTSVPVPDGSASYPYPDYYVSVSQTIPSASLQANTTYHYRLVSINSEGTGESADHTFSTAESTGAPPSGGGGGAPTGGETGPYGGGGGAGGGGGSGKGKGSRRVLKEAKAGGKTILVTNSGRSLYSLSGERKGHFICTKSSGCTGVWFPLTVPTGWTPKGPVTLGTVHRPEGSVQVTYRGHPLYTFSGDSKPGDVKGEGLKDVGTWHVATVPRPKHKR